MNKIDEKILQILKNQYYECTLDDVNVMEMYTLCARILQYEELIKKEETDKISRKEEK